MAAKLASLETQKALLKSETTVSESAEVADVLPSGDVNLTTKSTPSPENLVFELKHLRMENLHRLTGITAFRVPYLKDDGLGLRFELYIKGKFDIPHYIILRRDAKTKTSFQVYKHTIPHYVPVRELASRYLSSSQNLLVFVEKIRNSIYGHYKRYRILEQLQNGKSQDIVKHIETDNALLMWKLTLHDNRLINLVCRNNLIQKAIIYSSDYPGEKPHWEHSLQGPLESLYTRLHAFYTQ